MSTENINGGLSQEGSPNNLDNSELEAVTGSFYEPLFPLVVYKGDIYKPTLARSLSSPAVNRERDRAFAKDTIQNYTEGTTKSIMRYIAH
jgi:hypothetical protein